MNKFYFGFEDERKKIWYAIRLQASLLNKIKEEAERRKLAIPETMRQLWNEALNEVNKNEEGIKLDRRIVF